MTQHGHGADSALEPGAGHPLVSVIIPAYNYAHFILATIDSVRAQDYAPIEIIVIDDGSTDDTERLVGGLPGIRYVRQQNQGLPAARNNGMALARGKYLQFLDADDLLGPGSIRKRVAYLEANPGCSAVFCRSAFFRDRVYPAPLSWRHAHWRQPPPGQVDLALYYFNIAPPHAFLVRKAAVDVAGLQFDPRLRACEDYDFWFRLAQASGVPGQLGDCRVYYRQHANSMSRSYVNQYRHDAEMCRRLLADVQSGRSWLGARAPVDYLAAMYAASAVTARRLWHVDRDAFPAFLAGHVLPLQERLAAAWRAGGVTQPGWIYLLRARLNFLRLGYRDKAIDAATSDRLCGAGWLPATAHVAALSAPGGTATGCIVACKLALQWSALAALSGRTRRD